MNAVFQTFSITANVWLTKWSDDNDTANGGDHSKQHMYLGVYGALGIGQGMYLLRYSCIIFGSSRSLCNFTLS